ncbi:MAG TPA: DUF1552 domain-containing protein [Polyangiaceae bacterium]|nr:DUF1552 domain-containing protein [Polyangiaceae bacterium]
MRKFKLSRRAVIKGAGSIAIALPWLEAMRPSRPAYAQNASVPLRRFVTIYQPGGTVRQGSSKGDRYTPTGNETAFQLSPILAPLEPVKSRLLVVDGLDMKCADQYVFNVEQHQGGSVGLLTGAIQPEAATYPKSPSIDQVLAGRLSNNLPYASLQVAIRWATGKSHGKISAMNAMYFQASAPYAPIPPRLDPQDIFATLFGSLTGETGTRDSVAALRKKSILDFVDKRYAALSGRLGASDRARLDEHLTKVRELEKRLSSVSAPADAGACKAPARLDTTGYNATSGLNSADNGSLVDSKTDSKIPEVGEFMMDMLVMALACNMTGVASLQWTDTEAKHTFPWLNLNEHHHFYQHDGGFRPDECEKICNWYSQMHLYLLQRMQTVDMGGHSLLDESVVFFGSELSHPPSHAKGNMPFLLAGGDGKTLRTGRWLKYGGQPHNKLLTALLNVFGDSRTTFGDSRLDSTPLTGLA